MKTKFLRKTIAVAFVSTFAAYAMQAGAATLSFSQSTGFNYASGTLISNGATPLNDIGFYNDAGTGVTPPAGYADTIAWGLPLTTTLVRPSRCPATQSLMATPGIATQRLAPWRSTA